MKLAEALILRADSQKRIEQLRQRLVRSAKVQEGETPPEQPQETFSTVNVAELQTQMDQLSRQCRELDTRIQESNWNTELMD